MPNGRTYSYLRLDMGQFSEGHQVSRLIGAPPGYVGFGDGAQLTDALHADPYTVLLLDEIEKAHPDVLRLLLHLLDSGRLTAASGRRGQREIDARQAMVFFTSNAGAVGILDDLAKLPEPLSAQQMNATCRGQMEVAGLAPELIGRISSFVVYRAISATARREIVQLAVNRVAEEYGVRVAEISPGAVTNLVDRAGVTNLGARPDEHLIDEVLGETFACAAERRDASPCRLVGPPYRCEPLQPDDEPPEEVGVGGRRDRARDD